MGYLRQPRPVLGQFQNLPRGKELDTVGRWVAQRFEQTGGHQHRHVIRLAIEHPGRLLRRQPRRKLTEQGEKTLLFLFQVTPSTRMFIWPPRLKSPWASWQRANLTRASGKIAKRRSSHRSLPRPDPRGPVPVGGYS